MYRDVRRTTCGHYFCRDCIEGHFTERPKGTRMDCPDCHHGLNGRRSLKADEFFQQVVDHFDDLKGALGIDEETTITNNGQSLSPSVSLGSSGSTSSQISSSSPTRDESTPIKTHNEENPVKTELSSPTREESTPVKTHNIDDPFKAESTAKSKTDVNQTMSSQGSFKEALDETLNRSQENRVSSTWNRTPEPTPASIREEYDVLASISSVNNCSINQSRQSMAQQSLKLNAYVIPREDVEAFDEFKSVRRQLFTPEASNGAVPKIHIPRPDSPILPSNLNLSSEPREDDHDNVALESSLSDMHPTPQLSSRIVKLLGSPEKGRSALDESLMSEISTRSPPTPLHSSREIKEGSMSELTGTTVSTTAMSKLWPLDEPLNGDEPLDGDVKGRKSNSTAYGERDESQSTKNSTPIKDITSPRMSLNVSLIAGISEAACQELSFSQPDISFNRKPMTERIKIFAEKLSIKGPGDEQETALALEDPVLVSTQPLTQAEAQSQEDRQFMAMFIEFLKALCRSFHLKGRLQFEGHDPIEFEPENVS